MQSFPNEFRPEFAMLDERRFRKGEMHLHYRIRR